MKRLFILITVCIGYSLFCQTYKESFSNGTLYWGTFDRDNSKMLTPWEYNATIYSIEKEVNNGVTNYFMKGKDVNGKLFSSVFMGQAPGSETFVDDSNTPFFIRQTGSVINILCFKPLPKGHNLFLTMKITDFK